MTFMTQTRDGAVLSFFANVKSAFLTAVNTAMDAKSRSADVAKLDAMSDRQLADIGIARNAIVAHVYRDQIGL